MIEYNGEKFVNIDSALDISIKALALLIQTIIGFEGELIFNTTKPDGTPHKLMNVSYLNSLG